MSCRFTPNDYVRIKPTGVGMQAIVQHVDKFNEDLRRRCPSATFRASVPELDGDGCLVGQFWSVMQYFEGATHPGGPLYFEWMEPVPAPSISASTSPASAVVPT